jgi:hypothetical protein
MMTLRWIERASPERASRPDALIRIDAFKARSHPRIQSRREKRLK